MPGWRPRKICLGEPEGLGNEAMVVVMTRNWFRYLAFLCFLALPAQALAQPNGAQAKRAEIEARLKKWRGTILRKDVGLDEKKATDIERTLDKFQLEREKVQKDVRQQQKTLRTANHCKACVKALRNCKPCASKSSTSSVSSSAPNKKRSCSG